MEEAKKSEDPVKKIKAATELMNSIRDTSKEIKKLREENLKPTGEALQEEAPFAIKPGENFTIPDLNLTMIWVKPGTFMMGSPISEARRSKAETQHQVTLTQGFYLGKHEVTQAQWNRTMGSDPSEFKGAGLPVDRVSWEDAVKFTKKLTQMERKAGRVPEGMVYRLPTEAQWEYACRAGTITLYSWGDSISSKNASFERNRPKATTPVGKYPANPWGFFDMHGNVWEWCADRYGTYPIGSVTNPEGPASGSYRVKRGGSWLHNGTTLRSAKRSSNPPGTRHSNIGFRVAFLPNK